MKMDMNNKELQSSFALALTLLSGLAAIAVALSLFKEIIVICALVLVAFQVRVLRSKKNDLMSIKRGLTAFVCNIFLTVAMGSMQKAEAIAALALVALIMYVVGD